MTSTTTETPAVDRFSDEYRRKHLGASQWPAAVGMDPYQDPIELYSRFVGLTPWDDGPNAAARLGQLIEGGIADFAAEELGLEARPCPTLEHPGAPWACATPDRLLSDGTSLQVKTTRLVTRGSYIEEWGEPGTDEVPPRVLAQVTGEMVVARALVRERPDAARAAGLDFLPSTTRIAALIAGRGVLLYRVDYDEELAEMLWERVRRFWQHVEAKKPPPIDDGEAFTAFLSALHPEHSKGVWLDADDEVAEAARSFKEAGEQVKRFESIRDLSANILRAKIGDAEGVQGAFGKIAWRSVKGRESLDTKSLIAELRERFGTDTIDTLIKQHTARGAGHKRLTATWAK